MGNNMSITSRHVLWIHVRADARALQVFVPKELEIVSLDGSAWLTYVFSQMHNASWGCVSLPRSIKGNQCNIRTYVRDCKGVYGIYVLERLTERHVAKLLKFLHGGQATVAEPKFERKKSGGHLPQGEPEKESHTVDEASSEGKAKHNESDRAVTWTLQDRSKSREQLVHVEFVPTDEVCARGGLIEHVTEIPFFYEYDARARLKRRALLHVPWAPQVARVKVLGISIYRECWLDTATAPLQQAKVYYVEQANPGTLVYDTSSYYFPEKFTHFPLEGTQ